MLVAILCGLMLVLAGVAFAGLRQENGYVDRLTLSIGPALTSNADALQAMTDAESGLRGYASSRDLRFLEPYWGAHERAVADIATVRHSLQLDRASGSDDERDLLALVDEEGAALEAWWAYADQARLRAQQGQDIDLSHGKDLFDAFRVPNGQISDLVSSESIVLRASARDQLTRNTAVLALITALALAVGLLLGNRVSRSVTRPLRNLRSVVRRQRAGDHEARAREDQGAMEVRELAADFNALIAQNVSLSLAQAEALLMHELTREAARIVRAAPSADEAIEATCA
ncbi:MAG: CHASE3 domain-containing protein, partial [Oryzihumus sp.]